MTDDHFVFDILKTCEGDPDFKVHKFVLPAKKDWTVEKNWAIANPFIRECFESKGKRFSNVLQFYRDYLHRALVSKSEEHAFRRYLLGQYCGADLEYIPLEKIQVCGEDVYKDKKIRWALGCDYSITHDFTSVALVGWSQTQNRIYTKCWLYLPNIQRRRDSQKRVFTQWEQAGYLKIQNKDVLDGEQVASDVLSYLTEVGICPESICFDKALSGHHIEKFGGFKKSEIKMTAREMTPSIRELERVGCDGGLNLIGENACLRWQFGNIICSQKSKNYVLMDRLSPRQNIDGPVSITLGLKPLIENPQQNFVGFVV